MKPSYLRHWLTELDPQLGQRADTIWAVAAPIHERQSRPDTNENGAFHCLSVERNIGRFLKESSAQALFAPIELFLLSCGACCHDFDKGLISALQRPLPHGEGSGEFVIQNSSKLLLSQPEAIAVDYLSGIHDKKGKEFSTRLRELPTRFALPSTAIDLRRLAVVLKVGDTLHLDNSRVSDLAVNVHTLSGFAKQKHLARQCITGWSLDGTRVIVHAYPRSVEQMDALAGAKQFMLKKEWPSVGRALEIYGLPHKLRFAIDPKLIQAAANTAASLGLPDHSGSLKSVFQFYHDLLKPLFAATQLSSQVPVEVLFEIAAAFDHLSRHWTMDEKEASVAEAAHRHLRRATFDIFKLAVKEAIDSFQKLRTIDTSGVDGGDFDKRLIALATRIKEGAPRSSPS